MSACFKIDKDFDIKLLPYSPIQEKDPLEVRVQFKNTGDEDGETGICIRLNGEVIYSQKVFVKKGEYGFVKCFPDIKGKIGKNVLDINGEVVEFEVVKEHPVLLDGGFVMLGPPNDRKCCITYTPEVKAMLDKDWTDYINDLHNMRQTGIIIMVSHQYERLYYVDNLKVTAHYEGSKLYPKSDILAKDPIEAILSAADKNGQNVFIGVGNNYGRTGEPEDLEELFERYHSHKSFYGWYFACELNMEKFRPEHWDKLNRNTVKARELSPAKPILMSPYCQPGQEFIEYIEKHDLFDIMMPQDFVGQNRFTLADSRQQNITLLDYCQKSKKHLWANCEAFNFTGANVNLAGNGAISLLVPRYKNGGMDGEEGFIQQMETVRPYVEKIMNFMFSGFFTTPDARVKPGGKAAVQQYTDYMEYQNAVLEGKR